MRSLGFDWLKKDYPRNYIIRKPIYGSFWAFLASFFFMMLYRPLNPNDNKILGYEGAMAIYCFLACFTLAIVIIMLKKLQYFSHTSNWSVAKELLAILISLPLMSSVVYGAGFIIEVGGNPRFYDSLSATCLVGILPFLIFSLRNLTYLFPEDKVFNNSMISRNEESREPVKIKIVSKLKNESLEFVPGEFIYAESEGNYVTFYLGVDNKVRKITIRNSISDIENQLSGIPHFFRTHRAFIVNMRKISKTTGNALGYRLRLDGIENEVPVSRQNAREYNILLKRIFQD
ncbi:MAG: LytTR family DNA-binding domain-containing protein [Bacteroidales bacterium]